MVNFELRIKYNYSISNRQRFINRFSMYLKLYFNKSFLAQPLRGCLHLSVVTYHLNSNFNFETKF